MCSYVYAVTLDYTIENYKNYAEKRITLVRTITFSITKSARQIQLFEHAFHCKLSIILRFTKFFETQFLSQTLHVVAVIKKDGSFIR